MAHTRQSRPGSGLGCEVKVLKTFCLYNNKNLICAIFTPQQFLNPEWERRRDAKVGVLIRKIEEEVEAGQALARATGEAIKVPRPSGC